MIMMGERLEKNKLFALALFIQPYTDVYKRQDQARAVDLNDLGSTYKMTDKTGVSGEAVGYEEDWKNDAGKESLNGGKSFSGYTVMEDNEKYNAALSGKMCIRDRIGTEKTILDILQRKGNR